MNIATGAKKSIGLKLLAVVLLVSMLMQCLPFAGTVFAAETTSDNSTTANSLSEMAELLTSTTYADYLLRYKGVADGKKTVTVKAVDYDKELTDAKVITLKDNSGALGGVTGESLYIPDSDKTAWKFSVPDTGMYTVSLKYFPFDTLYYDDNKNIIASPKAAKANDLDALIKQYKEKYDYVSGKAASIERILLLDGKVPFKDARYITLSRVWADNYEKPGERYFTSDISGNEIRPKKAEAPEWRDMSLSDSSAFYTEPFKFYLEAGEHTITFDATREPVLLNQIVIAPYNQPKTYAEVKAEYEKNGYKRVSENAAVSIHAEIPTATSEQVIYPINDRTSANTYPHDPSKIVLNTIGGEKWQLAGQWIRYEFTPAETGLYQIIPRFKKSIYAGTFASRRLRINGKIPFAEANYLQFNFSDDWQAKPLNDGTTEFEFYFEAGKTYTFELEVTLGKMSDMLRQIDESLLRMNEYYRKILMITGPDPSINQDYDFARLIPEVLRGMRDEAELLTGISNQLETIIGQKGDHTVLLDKIAYILNLMGNNQDKIAANLGALKTNIGSLGTWLLTSRNQPLEIDSFTIQSADAKVPKAEASFFQSFWYEMRSFVMSFFSDYNSLGAMQKIDEKDNDILEVWVTTGREQATIMRQMVSEFTEKTNIPVNFKLIAAGTLLPATLAGVGPDVSSDADPVGFGVRNAALNLNEMDPKTGEHIYEGFDEVQSWFNPSALVPLTVYNPDAKDEINKVAVYGLPVTQSFSMLFYRKDIFVELGLSVPETWDDIYDMLRLLSEKNMSMGLSQGMTQILMYQQNIPWYLGDDNNDKSNADIETVGMATNLDSNGALEAFKTMCEFFTLYRQPVSYDFANRFRTGEMPIGIADYSLYNQLTVFAPEIRGLWEFVRIPGTVREDGTIDHTTPTSVGASMIMRDAKDPQKAWEYLKWWVGSEAQSRFGKEQVAIMGTAAKYNTANKEALESQPWSSQELINLRQQSESLRSTPMTPGNYIVARYTNFAFLSAYNDGESPAEAMLSYIPNINKEITRKRAEYDFLTYEDYLKRTGKTADEVENQ